MKFLPYEDFEIKTSFSPYDSVNRLKKVTGSKRHFWFWQTPKTSYQGKIEGNQFEISRSIGYRNSFLPIIKGEVRSDLGGSSITISMQLHVLVMLFMIFWQQDKLTYFLYSPLRACSFLGIYSPWEASSLKHENQKNISMNYSTEPKLKNAVFHWDKTNGSWINKLNFSTSLNAIGAIADRPYFEKTNYLALYFVWLVRVFWLSVEKSPNQPNDENGWSKDGEYDDQQPNR